MAGSLSHPVSPATLALAGPATAGVEEEKADRSLQAETQARLTTRKHHSARFAESIVTPAAICFRPYRLTAAVGVVALRGMNFSNIPVSAITFSISSISIGTNADRFS